jgi:hypothetical protein
VILEGAKTVEVIPEVESSLSLSDKKLSLTVTLLFADVTIVSYGEDGSIIKKRREHAMQRFCKGTDLMFEGFFVGLDPRNRSTLYKKIKVDSRTKDIDLLQGCKYTVAGDTP